MCIKGNNEFLVRMDLLIFLVYWLWFEWLLIFICVILGLVFEFSIILEYKKVFV